MCGVSFICRPSIFNWPECNWSDVRWVRHTEYRAQQLTEPIFLFPSLAFSASFSHSFASALSFHHFIACVRFVAFCGTRTFFSAPSWWLFFVPSCSRLVCYHRYSETFGSTSEQIAVWSIIQTRPPNSCLLSSCSRNFQIEDNRNFFIAKVKAKINFRCRSAAQKLTTNDYCSSSSSNVEHLIRRYDWFWSQAIPRITASATSWLLGYHGKDVERMHKKHALTPTHTHKHLQLTELSTKSLKQKTLEIVW